MHRHFIRRRTATYVGHAGHSRGRGHWDSRGRRLDDGDHGRSGLDGASRARHDLRTAAGDHNVGGAVHGLLPNGGRGDGSRSLDGTNGSLKLSVGDLADGLKSSHDGAGSESSEGE